MFYNRSRIDDISAYPARQLDDVESVCQMADCLSLHCAASADTFHILNAERLAMMKMGMGNYQLLRMMKRGMHELELQP